MTENSGEEQIPLRAYVDQRLDDMLRAVAVAAESPPATNIALREYIEALFDRDRAAREIADQEREKTAQALAAEREKTAQALAVALARQMDMGDHNLREHIDQQVGQIEAALLSLEKLTAQRHEASERAIAKAEAATESRFASVNEFRSQLSDQTATFLPREVAETQFGEIRKQLAHVITRLDRAGGSAQGVADVKAGMNSAAQIAIGALGLLVAVLSIAVVVILANA